VHWESERVVLMLSVRTQMYIGVSVSGYIDVLLCAVCVCYLGVLWCAVCVCYIGCVVVCSVCVY
jgi:hypothetical protein